MNTDFIPDLAELLGRGQNLIICYLWAIGYLVRLLPIENKHIPAIVIVASCLLTPLYVTPYRDAFTMSFLYAALAIISYEPFIRRLEDWITRKLVKAAKKDEIEIQNRPFKEDISPPTPSGPKPANLVDDRMIPKDPKS